MFISFIFLTFYPQRSIWKARALRSHLPHHAACGRSGCRRSWQDCALHQRSDHQLQQRLLPWHLHQYGWDGYWMDWNLALQAVQPEQTGQVSHKGIWTVWFRDRLRHQFACILRQQHRLQINRWPEVWKCQESISHLFGAFGYGTPCVCRPVLYFVWTCRLPFEKTHPLHWNTRPQAQRFPPRVKNSEAWNGWTAGFLEWEENDIVHCFPWQKGKKTFCCCVD